MSQVQTYAASGVDIDAGERFAQMIKERVARAWAQAAEEIGGFAGEVKLSQPVTCFKAGSDGSGTVAILGALTGKLDVVGINAAAISLVDLYVSGAQPVALLDVIDVASLDPDKHIAIVDGLILACRLSSFLNRPCVLLGGETAELPDMFKYDWMVNVNTTAIGIPASDIVTHNVQPGQKVYGWPSYGPASNGFSLIRKVFSLKGDPKTTKNLLSIHYHPLESRLADALLVPTPIWIRAIESLRACGVVFSAHAHITGGGLADNIPRVLPENCKVVLDRSAWPRPPIFRLIQRTGNVAQPEMDRVFNQGIMVASIVERSNESLHDVKALPIGTVVQRIGNEPQVQFTGSFND